jgi:hypothetical protein
VRHEIANSLVEEATRLDEIAYQVGDVLDVKASVILVVLTFLGTLASQVLPIPDLPVTIKIIQIVAVIALSIAGTFTICTLWPRKFAIPPSPLESWEYAEALIKHFHGAGDAEDLAFQQLQKSKTDLALDRIVKNRQLAASKAKFNKYAFYAMVVSVIAQLASLLWLAFWHLHL